MPGRIIDRGNDAGVECRGDIFGTFRDLLLGRFCSESRINSEYVPTPCLNDIMRWCIEYVIRECLLQRQLARRNLVFRGDQVATRHNGDCV